jgi:protein-tyrosine-phosphatase/predicted ATP-grasp superfamily ATP-dependent carboligase
MSSESVLVLDGHSRAAIECVQSLGRAGASVDVVCTSDDLVAHSVYNANRLTAPSPSAQIEFLDWLAAADRTTDYRLIIPSTEASLLALRRLPEDNSLRIKAILPSNRALDIALDKGRSVEAARAAGIAVPLSRVISSMNEAGPAGALPTVLKPVSTKVFVNGRLASVEAVIVNSAAARKKHLERMLPYFAVVEQEYISGTGVGVEFLYDHGHMVWHFGHERLHEWPLTGGASTLRRSFIPDEALLWACQRLLGALGWHGVAMVEFKRSRTGRYVFMEINPRLWGSLALSIDAGVNFPLGLYWLAEGHTPLPQPAYRTGYTTRCFSADFRWTLSNLKADHQNPQLLTQPRLSSLFGWMRPLIGIESWDHFDVRDWRITARIVGGSLRYAAEMALRPFARQQLRARMKRTHTRTLAAGRPCRRILFVCYGNICRSPFACHYAQKTLKNINLESSGFYPTENRLAPAELQVIASGLGVDLADHRSTRLTPARLEAADLIVLMDSLNYTNLAALFPEALDRTVFLGLFATPAAVEIEDPYGQNETTIRHVFAEIISGVDGLAQWLAR